MTQVLFTISVTGWMLLAVFLCLGAVALIQAKLMGLLDSSPGDKNPNTIRLFDGVTYHLTNGDKLEITHVCAPGYSYNHPVHRGKDVQYKMNGGPVRSATRKMLIDFLKTNVVTNENLSED